MEINIIDHQNGEHETFSKGMVADFLFQHLDQYGDKLEDILSAINYAVSDEPGKGGFVVVGSEKEQIVGAVVVNETGMSGYIPENILVYIAVHNSMRGKGAGKKLMQAAINRAIGDVALHVEPDNPAFHLYKKLGFDNKYLEMRFKRK